MDALLLGRQDLRDLRRLLADGARTEIPFTGLLNGVPKYVASRTLAEPARLAGVDRSSASPSPTSVAALEGPPRRGPRHRQPRPRAVAPALRARRPAGACGCTRCCSAAASGSSPTGPCPPRCASPNRSPIPSGTLQLAYEHRRRAHLRHDGQPERARARSGEVAEVVPEVERVEGGVAFGAEFGARRSAALPEVDPSVGRRPAGMAELVSRCGGDQARASVTSQRRWCAVHVVVRPIGHRATRAASAAESSRGIHPPT